MNNAERQRNFAARQRAEGLMKLCGWVPVDRAPLIKQIVQFYSECDMDNIAAEVERLGKGKSDA